MCDRAPPEPLPLLLVAASARDMSGGGSPRGSDSVEVERARDADAGAECVDDRKQQLHWHPAVAHAAATAVEFPRSDPPDPEL